MAFDLYNTSMYGFSNGDILFNHQFMPNIETLHRYKNHEKDPSTKISYKHHDPNNKLFFQMDHLRLQ